SRMRSRGALSFVVAEAWVGASPQAAASRSSAAAMADRRTKDRGFIGKDFSMRRSCGRRLQPVGGLGEAVGEVDGDFRRLVLVQAVFGDQPGQHRAVDAACDIVPR